MARAYEVIGGRAGLLRRAKAVVIAGAERITEKYGAAWVD